MSDWPYSQDELKRYFGNPDARKKGAVPPENGHSGNGRRKRSGSKSKDETGEKRSWIPGFLSHENPKIQQAIRATSAIVFVGLVGALAVFVYFLSIARDLPDTTD